MLSTNKLRQKYNILVAVNSITMYDLKAVLRERIGEVHLSYYASATTRWKLTNHHKTYSSVQC